MELIELRKGLQRLRLPCLSRIWEAAGGEVLVYENLGLLQTGSCGKEPNKPASITWKDSDRNNYDVDVGPAGSTYFKYR